MIMSLTGTSWRIPLGPARLNFVGLRFTSVTWKVGRVSSNSRRRGIRVNLPGPFAFTLGGRGRR
jgi:hypothetical protein